MINDYKQTTIIIINIIVINIIIIIYIITIVFVVVVINILHRCKKKRNLLHVKTSTCPGWFSQLRLNTYNRKKERGRKKKVNSDREIDRCK